MKFQKYISLFFIFFILISCKEKQGVFEPSSVSNNQSIVSVDNILGTWKYSFPFNSRELKILNNGAFKYYYRACVGSTYAEGNWYRMGNIITCQVYNTSNLAFSYLTLKYEDGFLQELDKYGQVTNVKFGREGRFAFITHILSQETTFHDKLFNTTKK